MVANPAVDGVGRPYGGRSPQERRAERRRRLLDAALELYGTAGYQATSVAQVCRAARVAPAKFYEEFADSEELLVAVAQEVWEPLPNAIVEAMAVETPQMERMLRAGLAAYVHGLLDDPRRARVLCIEVRGVSPAAEATRRTHVDQFARLTVGGFRLLRDSGQERVLDDRQLLALTTALLGAIEEAVRHWLYEPEPRPPVDDLVDMLLTVYVAVGTYLVYGTADRP